jgi:hypothetical protein
MKRKIKLNKIEWNVVITSLLRSERESITESFQEMYRKTREKIESQLYPTELCRLEHGKLYRLKKDFEDIIYGKFSEGTVLKFDCVNLGFAKFEVKALGQSFQIAIPLKIAFKILEEEKEAKP